MFWELKEVVLHLDVNSKTKRRIIPDPVEASPELKPRERWHAYELNSCCFAFCMFILAKVPSIQKKRPVQNLRKLVIKVSLGDGNLQFKFMLWKGRGGVWTFLIFLFLKNLFLVTYNFIKLELFRINFSFIWGLSYLPSVCPYHWAFVYITGVLRSFLASLEPVTSLVMSAMLLTVLVSLLNWEGKDTTVTVRKMKMNYIILSGVLPFSWAEFNTSWFISLPEAAFFWQLIYLLEKIVWNLKLSTKKKKSGKGEKKKRKGKVLF